MFRKPRYTRKDAAPAAVHRRKTDDRRGSSSSRGYTHRWQKYRERFLAEHPLCIQCMTESATVIDHIIPVAQEGDDSSGQDDPLFWTPWNHQPLCRLHHRIKTDRHDARLTLNRRPILARMTVDEDDTNGRRNELLHLAEIWSQWMDLETGKKLPVVSRQ